GHVHLVKGAHASPVGLVRPQAAGIEFGQTAEEVAAEEDSGLRVVKHHRATEVAKGARNRDDVAAGGDLEAPLDAVGGVEAVAGNSVVLDEPPGGLRADHRG